MKKLIFSVLCADQTIATSFREQLEKLGDCSLQSVECVRETNDIANRISDFDFNNFTTESCNELKTAIQTYLDSGCSPGQTVENSFRQTLETLGDCIIQ